MALYHDQDSETCALDGCSSVTVDLGGGVGGRVGGGGGGVEGLQIIDNRVAEEMN